MEKFIGKYYGPDKIKDVEDLNHKTPLENNTLKVSFADGDYIVTSDKTLEKLITDEQTDANDLRDRRYRMIYPSIVATLLEYGVSHDETPSLLDEVANNFLDVFERADHILWTGSEEGFVSRSSAKDKRTVLEADIILQNGKNNK